MTTNLDVLPTRIDGSLGRLKTDPKSSIALDHQVQAVEYETVADWTKELAAVVGPQTVYDRDTLRALLDPNFLHFRDPFMGVMAVLHAPWAATGGGTDWHYYAGIAALGTLDAIDDETLVVVVNRTNTPRLRFRESVDGDPGTGVFVDLRNGAGTVAVGVEFIGAANAINAFRDEGGVRVSTQLLGAWVLGVEYGFDLIVGAGGVTTVSMNAGTAVNVGALAADDVTPRLRTSADGAAGTFAYVRNYLLTANLNP